MKRVAIIPARGGSKRVPRKNVRLFLGRPVIAYSIDAAREAGCFDLVLVSTEDEEIAGIARGLGAEVPFMRSEATATDHASTADVVSEVLGKLDEAGQPFDEYCCVYATAPLLTADRIRQALQALESSGADAAITVTRFRTPVQRALSVDGGRLEFLWPENALKRTQDLAPAFHDCGQLYWGRVEAFLAQRKMFMARTIPVEVPEAECQDLDTEEDFALAELKYRLRRGERP